MHIFKCHHPFNKLHIISDVIRKWTDPNTEECTIKYKCDHCGEQVDFEYLAVSGDPAERLAGNLATIEINKIRRAVKNGQ